MGGKGSGNWYRWDSKETTESHKQIDIRWLRKQGCLRNGVAGSLSWSRHGERTGSIGYRIEADRMVLHYRHRIKGGDWEDVEQIISFDRTRCNYGGYRTWFLCPICWKRVAVLYGADKYFYCRHCYNLTYGSQQERELERKARKADKIRDRMGWGPGFLDGIGPKPKGMHWRTYKRLCAMHESLSWEVLAKLGCI